MKWTIKTEDLSWEAEGHGEEAIGADTDSVKRSGTSGIETGSTKSFTDDIKNKNENKNNGRSDEHGWPNKTMNAKSGGNLSRQNTEGWRHKYPHKRQHQIARCCLYRTHRWKREKKWKKESEK